VEWKPFKCAVVVVRRVDWAICVRALMVKEELEVKCGCCNDYLGRSVGDIDKCDASLPSIKSSRRYRRKSVWVPWLSGCALLCPGWQLLTGFQFPGIDQNGSQPEWKKRTCNVYILNWRYHRGIPATALMHHSPPWHHDLGIICT